MERNILYVGLDVHKNTISAAIADGRHRSQVRLYGKIDNTLGALDKLIKSRSLEFSNVVISNSITGAKL